MNRASLGIVINNAIRTQMAGALGGLEAHLMVGVHLLMLDNTRLGKG